MPTILTERDVLETIDAQAWPGPFPPETRARAIAALESGHVLAFPRLAFPLLPAEQQFLTPTALDNTRKSISRDPKTGQCQGSGYDGENLAAMDALLTRYAADTAALLHALLPRYTPALDQARTSFRPAEISGRKTSPRHDDRRLHVDAFPSRPMHGRRILRVFTNVAPDDTPRHWRVGENFADFAAATIAKIRAPFPGQFHLMAALGLTKTRRTPYDHIMLGLHDAAKSDTAYQANAPQMPLSFSPGTTWMCFTDAVLHAAMSGRCAMEQTFHIPVGSMAEPQRSPLRVLERFTDKELI